MSETIKHELPAFTVEALQDIAEDLLKVYDKAHDQVLFQQDSYRTPVNEVVRAISKALSEVYNLIP